MLYFNPFVRDEYALKYTPKHLPDHPRHYPLLNANDVAYTVHGLVCVMVIYYQVHFTDYKRTLAQSHVSKYSKILLSVVIMFCLAIVGSVLLQGKDSRFKLLDVAEILGYVKVCMSTSKYIPQLIYNHRRRSTKGWAMNSMILDIIGGLSSLAQLFLDGYVNHDIGSVWGNTAKLSLAVVTMTFDMLFLFQHYVLFADSKPEVISLHNFK